MSDWNVFDYLMVLFIIFIICMFFLLISACSKQDEQCKVKVAEIKAKYAYTDTDSIELRFNRISAAITDIDSLIAKEDNFSYIPYYQNEKMALITQRMVVILEDIRGKQ